MGSSPRLALPFLQPGQAQKEWFHNEALQRLDLIVAASVPGLPTATPPSTPAVGDCHIVAAGALGAWAGQDQALAGYTSGGWRFVAPPAGTSVYVRSDGSIARFTGTDWQIGVLAGQRLEIGGNQVVGSRVAAIAEPSGGATNDQEARTAIGQILVALRQHGLIAI